jgi:hypothetical protein
MTLNGAPVANGSELTLSSGTRLAADTEATFNTRDVQTGGNVMIAVGPASANGGKSPAEGKTAAAKTHTLGGGLTFGQNTTVTFIGALDYELVLPKIFSDKPGGILNPLSTNVVVATAVCSGEMKLDGASGGNTLGVFQVQYLRSRGRARGVHLDHHRR